MIKEIKHRLRTAKYNILKNLGSWLIYKSVKKRIDKKNEDHTGTLAIMGKYSVSAIVTNQDPLKVMMRHFEIIHSLQENGNDVRLESSSTFHGHKTCKAQDIQNEKRRKPAKSHHRNKVQCNHQNTGHYGKQDCQCS